MSYCCSYPNACTVRHKTCPTVAPTLMPVQSDTKFSNPLKLPDPQPVGNSPALYASRGSVRSSNSPASVPALKQINPIYHPPIRSLLKPVLTLPTDVMSDSSMSSLSVKTPHQNYARISLLLQTCHMPDQSHRPWCDYTNNKLSGLYMCIYI